MTQPVAPFRSIVDTERSVSTSITVGFVVVRTATAAGSIKHSDFTQIILASLFVSYSFASRIKLLEVALVCVWPS